MNNHRARTWNHRESKPLGPKLLPLDHHLDGYIILYFTCKCCLWLGVIIFGSVRFLSKQITKPKLKKNKTETRSNRPVSVCFLGQKPVQPGLAWFFWFWLGFSAFGSVLARFLRFGSVFFWFFSVLVRFGSVRFCFFSFLLIKPNRIGRFFQNFNRFNRFFFRFGFFDFFSGFLGLIGFLIFLLTSICDLSCSHKISIECINRVVI